MIKQTNVDANNLVDDVVKSDSNVCSSIHKATEDYENHNLKNLFFRHPDYVLESYAYIVQDRNFNVVFASDAFLKMTGYTSTSDLPEPTDFYVGFSEGQKQQNREYITNQTIGVSFPLEDRLAKRKDGSTLHIRCASSWVETICRNSSWVETNSYKKLLWTSVEDISDLVEAKEFSAAVLSQTSAIILTVNLLGVIQTCSDSWSNVTGFTRENTKGKVLSDYFEHVSFKEITKEFGKLSFHRDGITKEASLVTYFGEQINVILVFRSFIYGTQKKHIIVTITDVSKQANLEKKLKELLDKDDLTALYSRRYLQEKFAKVSREADYCLSVIDLDYFKSINDSYGHIAGDSLLVAVAETLQTNWASDAHCFRLGGEEFALIREWRSWEDTEEFSQNVLESINKTHIFHDGHEIQCSASIGTVLFEKNSELKESLKFADKMMREAKANGRNRVVIGNFETVQRLNIDGKFITIEEIQEAMEDRQLEYFVQPVVDAMNNLVVGFEALMRWTKPSQEVIEPRKFLDILYQAVRQPKYMEIKGKMRNELSLKLKEYPDQFISYNLKLEQIGSKNAASLIHSQLKNSLNQKNRKIVLELSEKALNDRVNENSVINELLALKEYGYRIALDDFGVEASNFQRLRDYPIDIVKIDRSFVKNLGIEKKASNPIETFKKLFDDLGLEIIVEGVETELQKETLLNLGLYTHQGFLYSRPVNTKFLPNLMHRFNRNK